MRKTALLTGVAGLFLITAPAFAQDSTATPQTPASPPAAEQPQDPGSLTLSPGQTVRGSDGADLGDLVGVRSTPTGQELTVRGDDGQVRGVPTQGISQQGADVGVGWTAEQFNAAPAIPGQEAPAPTPAPAPTSEPAPTSPPPSEPTTPPTEAPATPSEPQG